MAKFKKKKFRAEKSNSEDENKDLPEIEATEDEKKEIAKWTSNPDDAPETTDAPETLMHQNQNLILLMIL